MTRPPIIDPALLARYVRWHIEAHGYPPSVAELATVFNVHFKTANRAVLRAEQLGYIVRGKGWRSMQVKDIPAAAEPVSAPIIRSRATPELTRVDKVTVDFLRRTVTDPSGKVTPLSAFRALTPRRIEAFYHAAGYTVAERTARRVVMVKRAATLQEAA